MKGGACLPGDRLLRIEMVLPTLAAAGMETVVGRLACRLVERGHDVSVTCLEAGGPLAPQLSSGGVGVAIVPTPGVATNFRAPKLTAWFKSRAPDVVHSHSGTWLKAARAARRAGVPRVVYTIHGLLDHEPWYSSMIVRLAAAHTDDITAVSEPLRTYFERRHHIRAPIDVIPNGIDVDRFKPANSSDGAGRDLRATLLGDWSDCFIVGHVARLAAVKNQSLLLRAFRRVSQAVPSARLVIIGDGPLREELEAQCAELGLASLTRFVGARDDVAPWLRVFDTFALSSNAEGMSISILEAMATGVCVVATAVGGTPDLLEHGRVGVLVPPQDESALGAAIVRVARDHQVRRQLGSAARARAEQHFSERAMVSAYERLYRGMANRAGSDRSLAGANRS